MEKEHIKKIHKMNDDEFMALMEDLSNNSKPTTEQSEFSQELRQSKISAIAYDEPSPSTKAPKKLSHSNSRKMSSKSDDYAPGGGSKRSSKSTKSMHDLTDRPKHSVSACSTKGSSAKCIPDLHDAEHRFPLRQESFGRLATDRKQQQKASTSASIQSPRDNTRDVNNQYVPNNSSQSPSTTTTTSSHSNTAAAAESYLNNNNCASSSSSICNGGSAHSMNFFSAGNSLHNLQRCVEQINSPSAPIYDSVCRPNGPTTVNSYRNQDEDDSDKMEFGESHTLGHNSRIVEFRRNHSPVNKPQEVPHCHSCEGYRSLLPTPAVAEHNYVHNHSHLTKMQLSKKKNKKKTDPIMKAEEISGYVGDHDINSLDSFIRGEKNMQELEKEKMKALQERGKSASAANGDNNGGTGTSPENAQDQKKLRKKLKKKLNRDNRSISDRNLLHNNKQNGVAQKAKSASKPVSSNDCSSSEADEPEQASPASPVRPATPPYQSATNLKSQSLFLNDYELVSKTQSQEDLTEYQTVSDPEVEREKEFVTPKGKSFKKNKKMAHKAPVEAATETAVFDSRRGFSKRDLKRDVRRHNNNNNNGAVHSNGYESEREVNSFAPDSLNLPLKISSRNVLAPTGRTLPIVIDVSDGSRPSKARPTRNDNDSQMQRGNIVNGFFPRINDAITVFEPQAPSGSLSYAQIIKNKAAASVSPTAASAAAADSVAAASAVAADSVAAADSADAVVPAKAAAATTTTTPAPAKAAPVTTTPAPATFMFGNFDNEEIELLVNDAVIPQLYSAPTLSPVPNNVPRDVPNFNYFAAVNFVKDSWDEFKRVDYQTINTQTV